MSENQNREYQKFTAKPDVGKYSYSINDAGEMPNLGSNMQFVARSQGIEMCLKKIDFADNTKLLKDSSIAANCMGKLRKAYEIFLFGSDHL